MNIKKPWTITHKKWKLPMSKHAGGGQYTGPFRCVSTHMYSAVKFKSRELAWAKLDEVYMKYGKAAHEWKVSKIETARKAVESERRVRLIK